MFSWLLHFRGREHKLMFFANSGITCTCSLYFQHYRRRACYSASSLAKGFAHGSLSLHPWQIELDFVISADRHLAGFTGLAYKDDITFDQWVLLTVSCLGIRICKMAAPSVYIFDCIHVIDC